MGLTIRDLARICGVNASTVSRALRDDPRITPATREKVRQAARASGYRPNLTARNLAAGRTNSIWLFLGSLENAIERTPAIHLSRLFRDAGYDLQLVLHNGEPEVLRRLLRKLSQRMADGAILIPPDHAERWRDELPSPAGLPLLFLDRWLPDAGFPVVTTANGEAARQLAERCYQAGARFFVVWFAPSNPVSQCRRDAVCDWLDRMNLPYCTTADFTPDGMLRHGTVPVAVLSSNGSDSTRRLRNYFGAELERYRVLGGFFDAWDSPNKDCYERIFVCRQDFRGLAAQCAEVMVPWLKNGCPPATQRFEVPAEPIIEI